MTAPDDDTLRAWIAAADPSRPWPGRDAAHDAQLEELACAAPALAAEVLRLRAVIEHSADPQPLPTPAEVRAHRAAGGSWMVVSPSGRRTYRLDPSVPALRVRRKFHELAQVLGYGVAYVALGSDGLPCAWPDGGGR